MTRGRDRRGAPETVSMVFTDIVGSTALRQRLGEEAADRLGRAHDRLLRDAVTAAGGRVVKGTGDGILAVFTAAADALGAAVAIQRAVDRQVRDEPELALAVRVGVSAGDVVVRDGDVHGSAVVEAARLCDAAQGGQILSADLVRRLARGRGGFTFEPLGALELKGLTDEVLACRVSWEALPVTGRAAVPFPALLTPTGGGVYVGRLALLDRMHECWAKVAAGSGTRAVLLSGEPGVGKTRTATEVARRAFDLGGLVLYGRCDEALLTPYQPFVEALDWQTTHDPDAPLGRLPGELLRLLPDLSQRVPGLPEPVTSDPRVEQHRLYEAVASWLAATSADEALMLVLDDLHWAGAPTLQLLAHVLRSLAADPSARLLLVGTYRDTDLDPDHPLPAVIADLHRIQRVVGMTVENLSRGEVVALAEAAAGHPLDEVAHRLAVRTHEETDGNPFFVGEVLRHFVETGVVRLEDDRWVVSGAEFIDVPERLKDVIGRRLSRLSDTANTMLRIAAIVGRDVEVDVLAVLLDLEVNELLDVLDDALRARLVEEAGADRIRFVHAIVQTALYDEWSAARRRRAHGHVLDVMERLRPDHLGALAHHAVHAGPGLSPPDRRVAHCVAAGEQARTKRAHGDAERWFRQALVLADEQPSADRRLVLTARCGLGEALRDLGDPNAREMLQGVGGDALDAGEVDLAVRAAVANTRLLASMTVGTDHARTALLERLAVRPMSAADRVRILALLAGELTHDPAQTERRLALADEAIAVAGQLEDPLLQAWLRVTTTYPVMVAQRAIALAQQAPTVVALGDRSRDPVLRCMARFMAAATRMTVGDLSAARQWWEEGRELASADAAPVIHWMLQSASAQVSAYDGDLVAARTRNAAALELGQELGEPDAASWWGSLEGGLAWLDGSYPAITDAMGAFADTFPDSPVWRTAHAQALMMGGQRQAAEEVLVRHGLTDPNAIPEDWLTLTAFSHLAFIAFDGDLPDLAGRILPVLERHRRLWAHFILFCAQPMELAVGVALAAVGRWDEAIDATRRGRDLLAEREMRSHRPIASLYLARVLAARGAAQDLDEARTVARRGLHAAEEMGMEAMCGHLTELHGTLPRRL